MNQLLLKSIISYHILLYILVLFYFFLFKHSCFSFRYGIVPRFSNSSVLVFGILPLFSTIFKENVSHYLAFVRSREVGIVWVNESIHKECGKSRPGVEQNSTERHMYGTQLFDCVIYRQYVQRWDAFHCTLLTNDKIIGGGKIVERRRINIYIYVYMQTHTQTHTHTHTHTHMHTHTHIYIYAQTHEGLSITKVNFAWGIRKRKHCLQLHTFQENQQCWVH